jgi:sugar O-acyltransferase (sialic acid O-acetyltransferase NeuD family)
MKSLVVVGCGAHGRIVAETASLLGYSVVGFADDNPAKHGQFSGKWKVLGRWNELEANHYFVAIGNNLAREVIFMQLQNLGKSLPILVHPFSYVSPECKIGVGSVLLAGAVVQAGAVIKENVIVNIGAVVDHDSIVEAHAHLAQGAIVGSFGRVASGEILPPGTVRFRSDK